MKKLNLNSRLIAITKKHPVYKAIHRLSKSLRVYYYKNKKKLYWDSEHGTVNIVDGKNEPYDVAMYDFRTGEFLSWGFLNCECLKSC
jgi:hypothetical protein